MVFFTDSLSLCQLSLLFLRYFHHRQERSLRIHNALLTSKILKISNVPSPLAWLGVLFQLEYLSVQPTSFLIFYE